MPSLNDSMNVISGHPFCFIFFTPPASKMLPIAASKLITLSEISKKDVHLFSGMVIVSSFTYPGNRQSWLESSACLRQ